MLDAHETVILTATDAVSFAAAYVVDPSMRIFGPWDGALNNAGESVKLRRPDTPTTNGFVPYILSEDIEATLAKAAELGATIVTEKSQIPGIGYYALFDDPDGNLIGLFSE